MASNTAIYLTSLIYPALVALLASMLSYFATYRFNLNNEKKKQNLKAIDLIDKFIIALEKLDQNMEKLKENAEKDKVFLLKNIGVAKQSLYELKELLKEITLFDDDKLRKEILLNVDEANSLIQEIDELENIPVMEYRELQKTTSQRLKEYRTIRMQLLTSSKIFLDSQDSYKPKYYFINSKKENLPEKDATHVQELVEKDNLNEMPKNLSDSISSILNDLVSDIQTGQAKLQQIQTENASRRSFIAIRILNTQNKLKDLKEQLITTKDSLKGKRYFI